MNSLENCRILSFNVIFVCQHSSVDEIFNHVMTYQTSSKRMVATGFKKKLRNVGFCTYFYIDIATFPELPRNNHSFTITGTLTSHHFCY